MFSDRLICCVPGCAHTAAPVSRPDCVEVMCEAHYTLASPAAQKRRARQEGRLRALQQCFDDEAAFDRLIASGKYLKLCSMLSLAADNAERAWLDMKAEVLAAANAGRVSEAAAAAA